MFGKDKNRKALESLSEKIDGLIDKIDGPNKAIDTMNKLDRYDGICEIVNNWNQGLTTSTLAMERIKAVIENRLRVE